MTDLTRLAALSGLLLLTACTTTSTAARTTTPLPVVSAAPSPTATPDDPNAPIGPCDLLTSEEVSTALGVDVSDGKQSDQGPPLGGHECVWATPAPPIITFQVVLRTAADLTATGQTPADLYASTVALFKDPQGLTATAGIGDRAAVGPQYAYVLKGGTFLMTSIGSTGDPAALLALTRSAAAQL